MRIKLKLIPTFPHVQMVEMSFLEKPIIDYVLKPLGGETFGFDIANIPGAAYRHESKVSDDTSLTRARSSILALNAPLPILPRTQLVRQRSD